MKQILIPDLGDIGDVDIIEIPIEVGDSLQPDDTMLVLESEKATMEVPVPEAGVVKEILLKVGDKTSEGALALMLEVDESEAEKNTKTQQPTAVFGENPSPETAKEHPPTN